MKKDMPRKARTSHPLRGALGLALVLTAAQGCKDEWTHTADFKNPTELQPEGGVYKLRVGPAEVTIEGKRYCLRTYNGLLTSPTLRVPAASGPQERRQFRVDLTNTFQDANNQSVGSNHHSDFNTTNLHTHGLHVSPDKTADGLFASDDVLLKIKPQESKQFRFDIDAGRTPHRPGTFWYHPHVHGSTAIQVANGMAGALIIQGDVDQLSGIRDAQERIFLFQQIPYDYEKVKPLGLGERCDEKTLSINDFSVVNQTQKMLVNGIPRPLLTVPPKQVERWRLIHAGVTQFIKVSLYKATEKGCADAANGEPIPLQQIAEDGITFPQMEQRNFVQLAPGYRADVMVRAPEEEGTYCVIDAQSEKLDPVSANDQGPEPAILLAILKVDKNAGAPTGAMPSNDDLKQVAPPIDGCEISPKPDQEIVFAQKTGCPNSSFFNINCKEYDENAAPRALTLGKTEMWQVRSEAGNHPFHIHVNSFLVCPGSTVNGEKLTKARWKDTLYVDKPDTEGNTKPVWLRTTYEDFTGKFVTHCHLLHHEDQGMMEAMEIKAAP